MDDLLVIILRQLCLKPSLIFIKLQSQMGLGSAVHNRTYQTIMT